QHGHAARRGGGGVHAVDRLVVPDRRGGRQGRQVAAAGVRDGGGHVAGGLALLQGGADDDGRVDRGDVGELAQRVARQELLHGRGRDHDGLVGAELGGAGGDLDRVGDVDLERRVVVGGFLLRRLVLLAFPAGRVVLDVEPVTVLDGGVAHRSPQTGTTGGSLAAIFSAAGTPSRTSPAMIMIAPIATLAIRTQVARSPILLKKFPIALTPDRPPSPGAMPPLAVLLPIA